MTMLANTTGAGAMTLADYEARIHLYKEQIGVGYIGIGRTLNEAKEAKVVPHGEWESWVTRTTGLTPRQAQRCMQAATEIRDGSALARLEMSKALLLLSSGLEEEEREEIAARAADESTTVKALKEEIRQAKLKLVQETGAAAEIRDALKKTENDRRQLENQLKATIEAYQKRMDEESEKAYRRGLDDQALGMEKEIRKEFQDKIEFINGERRQADERIRDLQAKLKDAENAGSARWDAGYRAGMNEAAEIRREVNEQRTKEIDELQEALDASEKELAGAQNELNKQRQYAESLREELEKQKSGDREILLQAAEEAERRAADAEAELEALRAGQAAGKKTTGDLLEAAVAELLSGCGMMPFCAEDLAQERTRVIGCLSSLEDWLEKMWAAVKLVTVDGEGAVE